MLEAGCQILDELISDFAAQERSCELRIADLTADAGAGCQMLDELISDFAALERSFELRIADLTANVNYWMLDNRNSAFRVPD